MSLSDSSKSTFARKYLGFVPKAISGSKNNRFDASSCGVGGGNFQTRKSRRARRRAARGATRKQQLNVTPRIQCDVTFLDGPRAAFASDPLALDYLHNPAANSNSALCDVEPVVICLVN